MATNRTVPTIGMLIALLALQSAAAYAANQAALPLPEYLGVYAVSGGKLIELSPNSQSKALLLSSAIGGADIINSLSGKNLPDGNIQFIIFLQNAARFTKIPALRISKLRNQLTLDSESRVTETERLDQNSWHLSDQGFLLRVAPIPQNPTMMIRAALEAPLGSGLWAIRVGADVYDFGVGDNPSTSADCEDRYVSLTGATYRPCSKALASDRESASTLQAENQPEPPPLRAADHVAEGLTTSYTGTAIFPLGMTNLDNLFKECTKEIQEANYTITESDRTRGTITAVHKLGLASYGWTMNLREDPQNGITAVMTRGTSRRFAPKDIDKLFQHIAEQMRLDQGKITLTINGKTKPLSSW